MSKEKKTKKIKKKREFDLDAAEEAYRLAVRCPDCIIDKSAPCCYAFNKIDRDGLKAALGAVL